MTWQSNLRAVALGLEALRKVERYGITRRGEEYQSFRALPGGTSTPAGPMSEAEALRFLAEHSGIDVRSETRPDRLEFAYRAAAKKLHPDRRGGDTALFQHIQEAMRVPRGENP